MTKVETSERERKIERLDNVILLSLKTEGGSTSQGILEVSSS